MVGAPLVTALASSVKSSSYFLLHSKFLLILYLIATVGIFDLYEVKTIIIFD